MFSSLRLLFLTACVLEGSHVTVKLHPAKQQQINKTLNVND